MRLKPAVRQSPEPEASAYSNVWLQCCQAKPLPSGAVRRSPSIQIPDGHALHERISDMCSVPSGVTTQPGVPRFSTATDRPASGAGRHRPFPVAGRRFGGLRACFCGVSGVHHGVRQVRGQRADRRGQRAGPGARHDQRRQVAGSAHVGVRAEGVRPVPGRGHPQPRRPGIRGQPDRQRLGVAGPGGG